MVFAEISAVGGMVLSPAPGVPVSVFVTTISFAIFLLCWAIGRRDRVAQGPRRVVGRWTAAQVRA